MTLVERLILENKLLRADSLDQFQVYKDNSGTTYFLSGTHYTNAGNSYDIWSPIPNLYPNHRPPMYVTNPNPLRSYNYGVSINSYSTSHNMHTLSNGPNREVQICHWRDDRWHSGLTLNKVMLKVVIWLEAYEQHLATGQTINSFVRTMQ